MTPAHAAKTLDVSAELGYKREVMVNEASQLVRATVRTLCTYVCVLKIGRAPSGNGLP